MESPVIFRRSALMLVLLCLGITFTEEVTVAQCLNRGTVVDDEVSNSQGKPYQAKEIRTIVTYGSGGTKRIVVTKSSLFRDSKGRIRVERFYDGTEDPSENVPTDISIDDNCGTFVILLPARQTAKITRVAAPVNASDQPCCQEIDLKNPPYTGPEGKVEDLGHKFVDGVEVRGERISYYSSAQAKLSGASPVRIYESWCSISLDTQMGDYILDDKPKREITTVISEIKQVEPDSALFEIPEGYKVIRADQSAPASNANGSQSTTSAHDYGSRPPTLMGQEVETQPRKPTGTPDATSHEEMKFKLIRMSNGFTKNGFTYSGLTYETATHAEVDVKIVHVGSREGAKKEYDDQLKGAVRIIEQGKVQDKPATKPATTEDRAVIVVPSTAKDCKEMFAILATAGTVLRIHQSCSLEAVVELEKGAKHNESVDDRFVFR